MNCLQITCLLDAYNKGTQTVEGVIDYCLEKADELPAEVWIHRFGYDEIRDYIQDLQGHSSATKPLYGIPFVIKDNIDLAGIPTTAGCPEYAYTPAESAFVVARLISAGAIPLGKTNLDQFATGLVGTRSPYGECRNSFAADYISGGSSSGSAVAVAAGCCSFSLGTDTAGSGRVPAAFNNLIGLKPSKGLLSITGVVPACRSLDCVSIFALDAADALAVFNVAAGTDSSGCYSRELNQAAPVGSNWTFGVPRAEQLKFFGNAAYEQAYYESLHLLEKAGGRKVEIDFQPFLAAAELLYSGPWVNERYAAVGEFIEAHPEAVLETTLKIIKSGLNITAVEVFEAMYRLQELKKVADRVMSQVDVMVTPTAGTCYTRREVAAEPIKLNTNLGYYTNFMNLLDYTAVAVPTAACRPVPFGVTLFAPAGHDRKLLGIADMIQQKSGMTVGTSACLPVNMQAYSESYGVSLAVCGAHLQGCPLHYQLRELNASFIGATVTADEYRMFSFESGGIRKPGLIRDSGQGESIYVEVYRLSYEAFGKFVADIPAPLGIGKVKLGSGEIVCGFIAEPLVEKTGEEITAYGDWRKYCSEI